MLEKPITWQGVNWNMWPRQPANHPNGYCIRTISIDGMWMPEFTTETHKRPGKIGDRSFDQFPSSKTVTLTGTIRATTMTKLRDGQARMFQAWWQGLGPYATHFGFQLAGTPQLYLMARLGQKPDMVEVVDHDLPVRTWTFMVRADDPRVYQESNDSVYWDWQVLAAP